VEKNRSLLGLTLRERYVDTGCPALHYCSSVKVFQAFLDANFDLEQRDDKCHTALECMAYQCDHRVQEYFEALPPRLQEQELTPYIFAVFYRPLQQFPQILRSSQYLSYLVPWVHFAARFWPMNFVRLCKELAKSQDSTCYDQILRDIRHILFAVPGDTDPMTEAAEASAKFNSTEYIDKYDWSEYEKAQTDWERPQPLLSLPILHCLGRPRNRHALIGTLEMAKSHFNVRATEKPEKNVSYMKWISQKSSAKEGELTCSQWWSRQAGPLYEVELSTLLTNL